MNNTEISPGRSGGTLPATVSPIMLRSILYGFLLQSKVMSVPMKIDEVALEAVNWSRIHRNSDDLRNKMAEYGAYIYGAGGFGREVAKTLVDKGIACKRFIDGQATDGKIVDGMPCIRPSDIAAITASHSCVVIAVNNFKSSVGEIDKWIKQQHFAEVITVPDLPDVIDPSLGHYWQSRRELMADNIAQISALNDLLGDDASRSLLADIVRYRTTGRFTDHPAVDMDHQYFPLDLPMEQTSINVVDCGAFPGDMLQATALAGLSIAHWYAFEPDPNNFGHLCKVARDADVTSAALFPCGVGDMTGIVHFADGRGDASSALIGNTDGAGVAVPIVRVDDVIVASGIDMVKLDIEGFESQAIDGMANLLDRHRPRLAVAIYHKPADLWELPMKINSMFPGTRFAMRQHGHNGYDTVLYADL